MREDGVAADEDVFRWYRFDDEILRKDKISTQFDRPFERHTVLAWFSSLMRL